MVGESRQLFKGRCGSGRNGGSVLHGQETGGKDGTESNRKGDEEESTLMRGAVVTLRKLLRGSYVYLAR